MSTDNIGDSVLRLFILKHIALSLSYKKLIVICQHKSRDLFHSSPYVDAVFTYNRKIKVIENREYGKQLSSDIRNLQADLVINPVPLRNSVDDFIALSSTGAVVIGIGIGSHHTVIEQELYSSVTPYVPRHRTIHEINQNFSRYFWGDFPHENHTETGIVPAQLQHWADSFFKEHSLDPTKTIAVYSGVATSKNKEYFYFGKALDEALKDSGFSVIALGGPNDVKINKKNFSSISLPMVDITGALSLVESAALIEKSVLAFGSDCGLTHIACAVNTPNVTLVGLPALATVLPYTSLSTVISYTMECPPQCNWNCVHDMPYCIQGVPPDAIAKALKNKLFETSEQIQIYLYSHKGASTSKPSYQTIENKIALIKQHQQQNITIMNL